MELLLTVLRHMNGVGSHGEVPAPTSNRERIKEVTAN